MHYTDWFGDMARGVAGYIDQQIAEGFKKFGRKMDDASEEMHHDHYAMMGLSRKMDELTDAHFDFEGLVKQASIDIQDQRAQHASAYATLQAGLDAAHKQIKVLQLQLTALQAEILALHPELQERKDDGDTQRPDQ